VLLETSGAQGAFPALNELRADIGNATRPPNAAELAAFRNAYGLDASAVPQEQVVALDGLAVIVNAENPVQRLTLDQLRDVYAGAVTNWAQLGGPNRPIQLFARENASAAWGLFNGTVMRGRPAARAVERPNSDTAISSAVAGEAGAIGLVPFAYIGRNRALNLAASCSIEYEASEFGMKTEDYPLARRNYFYASPRGGEPVAEFLRFAASPAAYAVVQDAGYASLQPVLATREHTVFRLLDATRAAPAAPDSRYAEAMMEYNLATRGALRLSTTFRFVAGGAQLDGRGLDDIERVAEFLRRPENGRYRVTLLGFTDAAGAFGQNRAVAERRAGEVAAQLRQRGVQVAQARGFGPIAPVACDDDPEAATRNRRVEVWLGQ
jgi:phosphate transport system substrate-binding protein